MATRIQLRRDTAANWESVNPVLAQGELGLNLDTNQVKVGDGVTAWNSMSYTNFSIDIDELDGVTITNPQNGDFLRYSSSASVWVNDPVNLSTDTVGDYVQSLVAGTGVSVTNNSGEGTTPTIAIGQAVGTSSSVTFAHVSADVTGDLVGNVTGDLTGNADTATALETARTIELSGDISGSASFDGTSNINIFTTVNTSSVAITELFGVAINAPEEFQTLEYDGVNWTNTYASVVTYVRNAEETTLASGTAVYLFGGNGDHASVKRADNSSDTTSSKTVGLTGVSINPSENGPVITRGYVDGIDLSMYSVGDVLWLGSNGQLTTVKPSAPQHLVFIGVVVRATLNGIVYVAVQNGYELEELHDVKINGLADGQFLRYNSASTVWTNDAINLGTDTVGDYVSSLVAGTGVTLTNNSGESASPTIAIGQAVGTSSSVTFSQLTVNGQTNVGGHIIPDTNIAYDLGSETNRFRDIYLSGTSINLGGVEITSDGTSISIPGGLTGDLSGNADTATALETARTISLLGDVSGSVSFDGSSNVNISATIQPNSVALGTDTTGNYVESLVAGTGVTLSNNSGEGATPTVAIGQDISTSASPTFARITISGTPSSTTDAVTKSYVDNVAAGVNWHEAVSYATSAVLPNTPSYDNGLGGVGATLTAGSNARLMVDGLNASTGNRILVKNQSSQIENGIYDVTAQGSVSAPWVLTRAEDFNQDTVAGSIDTGEAVYVRLGNNNAGTGYVLTSTGTGTGDRHIPGTDNFVFTQFSGLTTTVAGAGLTTNGAVLTVGTASTGRIVVNADDIDLATVAQSNSTTADSLVFAKTVNVDSYGRVTGVVSASVDLSSKANLAGPTFTGTVVLPSTTSIGDVSSTEIGYLNNVTSAIQTQIDSKAPTESPTFTGTVTLPNNTVALGTKTTGDYVQSLVAGTGVTLSNNSGESATPTVAIGQAVETSSSVTFAHVSAPLTGNVIGNVTGNVTGSSGSTTGNAATATTLETARTISITGDVSGSVSFNGSQDVSISATVQPNSVALGTDTTGNYVNDVTAGTGISVTHTPGEGSSATVAINATLDNLSDVTVPSPSSGDFLKWNGSAWVNDPINLGTDTSGNYMSDLTQGTGVTITHTPSEGSNATIAIGQAVATSDSPTFAALNLNGNIVFEGTTADNFETTLSVTDPTEDRTITLPNVSGTVVTTGDTGTVTSTMIADGTIVNGDINASAAIADTKLATISTADKVSLSALNIDGGTDIGAALADADLVIVDDGGAGTNRKAAVTRISDYVFGKVSGDVTIASNGAATIAANSVALGTDTTGNYVNDITAGTGVTVTHTPAEGSSPTIAIGQAVGTSSSVTFARVETTGNLVVGGDLSVTGTLTTVNETNLAIEDTFIYLNDGSTTTNPDLGWVGNYNDGTYAHAGIFRDATDGKFKFFDSYTLEPADPINTGHASYSAAPVVAEKFESTIATGTAPLSVSSSTVVTNLNADLLDGQHGSYYAPLASPTFTGTVTLPTGTVTSGMILDGTIANADINASAAIALSKLASGTSGQIIVANSLGVPTWVSETGDVTISDTGVTAIASGVIVNADVNASAAIDYSKLAALTSGNILVGNASNVATSTAVSGDITITNAGVTAIGSGVIVNADINASAAIAHSKLANATAGQVLLGTTTTGVVTATTVSGDVTITGAGVTAIGSGVIVNADINSSAAIAHSKLATAPQGQVLLATTTTGTITATPLTGDVTIDGAGVTAIGSGVIVNADINASAAIDKTKISGTAITAADTGTVTSAMIADGTIVNADISSTAAIDLGKLADVSTNAKTASYTLVLGDKNKVVEMNVASANNLTVPLNSSVAFPVGSQINILQTGAGQTTVVATGGVTINATPGLKMRAQWSYATLIKRATDTWVLVGDISA